jgi:hypothetical protein
MACKFMRNLLAVQQLPSSREELSPLEGPYLRHPLDARVNPMARDGFQVVGVELKLRLGHSF